jgi:WD40 repeat protein
MNLTKAWAAQLEDYVIDLAWSPDGRVLASASAGGPVTLFDAQGARLHELSGHADGTNAVAFAPAVAGVATSAPASAADPGPASARPATTQALFSGSALPDQSRSHTTGLYFAR